MIDKRKGLERVKKGIAKVSEEKSGKELVDDTA